MTLPYSILLIPFGLLAIGWAIFSILALRQVLRFGFLTPAAVMSACMYLAFAFIVFSVAALNIRGVNWSATVTISAPSISNPLPGATNTSTYP
jgi:hypothetical protein